MSKQIVLEKDEEAPVKVELPQDFEEFINKKLNQKWGRISFIKRLGSLDAVLEVLEEAWISHKSVRDIAKKYKVDKSSVQRLLADCGQWKEQIIEYVMYRDHVVPKDFRSYKSIQNWIDQIYRSGHLSALVHIPVMEWICTGGRVSRKVGKKPRWSIPEFTCNPDKFDLEEAQRFITLYLKKYNATSAPKRARMAIRHFLASKNMALPRGFGAQYGLSGEKISYGKYAHIKLSEEQIALAREIIRKDLENRRIVLDDYDAETRAKIRMLIEKLKKRKGSIDLKKEVSKGFDSGFDLAFELGITTCARAFALCSIPISRIRKEGNLNILEVFEPKVKEGDKYLGRIGKWWRKYVNSSLYEKIMEFVEKYPQRVMLFVDGNTKSAVDRYADILGNYLKTVYYRLGLKEEYFYKKPLHSLRHIGAHRLLKLTDYNYDIVARLGGWKTAQIVKDCYGAMPEDVIIQVISKLNQMEAIN